ncbi:MAG TPA: ScpA family protein, partial [Alphaproteobacteria bacterium]|nr:ScpA family protein [Alphaproteobacteria bacterium]
VLLMLARDQKVDLAKISILQLADQYLDFMARARRLRLELRADYLVMAAWLAYLKSRLLLPDPPSDDEPSGEQLAEALAFQLQRLEAMREAAGRLMALPRLGRDVFARGAPEGLRTINQSVFDATLYDLLTAYGDHRRRQDNAVYAIEASDLFSIEDALNRMSGILGGVLDWTTLETFLPSALLDGLHGRSALAAHFVATLELAKSGFVEVRQDGAFAPIFVRRAGGGGR